jgi:hypothetical protein
MGLVTPSAQLRLNKLFVDLLQAGEAFERPGSIAPGRCLQCG